MSLLRQSAWAVAAAVTLTGARFALAAILARRLSQVGFGQFAYAQWLVDLAFLLSSFGVTAAATRYVAEYRNRPDSLSAVMKRWWPLVFGLPILAGGVVLVGAFVSELHLNSMSMAWLSLWVLASSIWAMQTAALSGLQRFDLVFLANAIAAITLLTGSAFVPVTDGDMSWVFALMAGASAAASLVGISATRGLAGAHPTPLDTHTWRGIRNYALNMWATALLASLVWSRGEMPIVRAALGDAGVAQYAAALTLFGGAMQGAMLAVSAVAPQLTRLWGEGAQDQALSLTRRIMDAQLLLSGLVALALMGFSSFLMTMAFGPAYVDGSTSLVILSLALLATATSCHNHLLQIATDARFNRNTTLLALVLLLAMAYLFVGWFGLIGAALARAGTILSLSALALFFVHRRWGPTSFSKANLAWVLAVISLGAGLTFPEVALHASARIGFAILGSGWLAFIVRGADGTAVSAAIVKGLMRSFTRANPIPVSGESKGG